ncbi:MAG: prolyl oligopeptidase family serine peptidase [Planctomycetes bacterium]|nr:prolyl oligopeptidase family serine peptidase [Planctomycetota bacterium]
MRPILAFALLLFALPAAAQAPRTPTPAKPGRQKIEFGTSYYVLSVPGTWKPGVKLPMIVMFHGSGGRPESYENHYTMAKKGYIVCLPAAKVPAGYDEDDMKQVFEIVKEVIATYSVDRDRVFCSGHSAGGFVTCHLCTDHTDVFTAGAPVSGCLIDEATARKLLQTPFRVVSGGNDFNHDQSKKSVEDMKKAGMDVTFEEPADWAHTPPPEAWQHQFEWLDGLVPPDAVPLLQGARSFVEAKQYGKAGGMLKKLAATKSAYVKNRAALIAKEIDEAADKAIADAKAAGDAKKTLDLLTKAKSAFAGSEAEAKVGAALDEAKGATGK